ncbi:MAG: hypothetical protein JWQ09_3907 [Segetibacter sp.]|nr:hypothetical protein [Segetibacter sp.]
MSEQPIEILLADILDAINAILEFVKEVEFEQFISDRMRRDAIARNIEVIGEAINKLPNDFINIHSEVEWHKAISMLNRLIHEYFGIDYKIVWNTIRNILPDFKTHIEKLLIEKK